MYRRLLPLSTLTVAAIPLLSSCAVVDALGPRPNSELLVLAEQAVVDETAHAQNQPAYAELRARQADELIAEITRLCGTSPAGEVPETCEVDRGELAGSAEAGPTEPEQALTLTLSSLDELPGESTELVTAHAVDLAGADGDTTLPQPPAVTAEEDLTAARQLLEQEYAVEYGLGVAGAFIAPADQELLDSTLSAVRERILSLQLLLEPTGPVPAARPGYEFTVAPEPLDPASAGNYVRAAAADEVLRWQAAAADAASAQWRDFAVATAAHAETHSPVD